MVINLFYYEILASLSGKHFEIKLVMLWTLKIYVVRI